MGSQRLSWQDVKFRAYGFLKDLRFFEAFLLIYLLNKGISYTLIGVLYAVREITTNLLEIPSGIAADVMGRRRTLASSLLAYIVSFVLFYLFSGPVPYLAAFTFYGIGEAFRSGTHKGMIADYLEKRGERKLMTDYYGKTRAWSQMGMAMSSLFAGPIVLVSGNYDWIFLLSTVPYIINFFNILSSPPYLDEKRLEKTGSRGGKMKDVLTKTLRSVTDRKVLNLISLSALHTAYLKAAKDYIQPMLLGLAMATPILGSLGEDRKAAVFIGIVYFLIYLLTSKASAMAPDLVKSPIANIPYMTLLAGFAAGLLSGFFYYKGHPWGALVFFTAVHLIENIRKPVMTGYITDNVDGAVLTSILSVESQLKTIFMAVLALLLGFSADRFGVGAALALNSAGLIAVSLILRLFSVRKKVK